jgi:ATP-dependent Clp protease protease subunit
MKKNCLQDRNFIHQHNDIRMDEQEEEKEDEKSSESGHDPFLTKMLKTRTILLSGEIKKDLAERTIRQLLLLEDMGEEPIRMFIDSPGGDADAGYAIFDMIRFVKPPVWTIGMGLVASAAAIIQLAAPRERRFGLRTVITSSISPFQAFGVLPRTLKSTPGNWRNCGNG